MPLTVFLPRDSLTGGVQCCSTKETTVMATPKAGRSIEGALLGEHFLFDEPSQDLRIIRAMLLSGISVVLTQTDIPGGIGRTSRREIAVSFYSTDGEQYLCYLRRVLGEYITEFPGEHVMRLGSACPEAKRLNDALAAMCTIYLIPQEEDGLCLSYTLCVVAP